MKEKCNTASFVKSNVYAVGTWETIKHSLNILLKKHFPSKKYKINCSKRVPRSIFHFSKNFCAT